MGKIKNMPNNLTDNGMTSLLQTLKETTLPPPIWDLEKGAKYLHRGSGTVFVNNFTFEVIEDIGDEYIILVEGQMEIPLEKNFELLEAFERKEIIKIDKGMA